MVIMIALAVITAAAILLIFFGLAGALGRDKDLEARLNRYASMNATEMLIDEEEERRARASFLAQRVERAVSKTTYSKSVAEKLARADATLTIGEYIMTKIIAGLAAVGLALALARNAGALAPLIALVFALPGSFLPDIYLGFRAKSRLKKFGEQLGDAVQLLANSLRSGYSLLQSMELVAKETPAPMGLEFRRVLRETGLGISYQDAMSNMLRRVPSEDLDLLITAINIQHEVGGNLAQILDTIGHTIRERVRIKGEISVLTAQGTISGYVITLLPIGLGAFLFVINPGYISRMFVWPFICMPIGAGIMIAIGYFVMRKIVAIEV